MNMRRQRSDADNKAMNIIYWILTIMVTILSGAGYLVKYMGG